MKTTKTPRTSSGSILLSHVDQVLAAAEGTIQLLRRALKGSSSPHRVRQAGSTPAHFVLGSTIAWLMIAAAWYFTH